MKYLPAILAFVSCFAIPTHAANPRLIVLTDIGSLTAGVGEPDDGQSMIRLMLYTNEINVEGLIATSNMTHGHKVQPELIRQVIEAYGKVQPNLFLHDKRYPEASQLLPLVRSGQPVAGPRVAVSDSVGEGKDTEGSEWIIKAVDYEAEGALWVVAWGGSADFAQALWKVRKTRSPEELFRFVRSVRLDLVYDQDSTGQWIRDQFPDLYCITRNHSIRGMYRAGDFSLVSPQWVDENLRIGHGALGALYPNYNGGDIWATRLGQVRGVKEGDTPTILRLMDNGLNDPYEPDWGSWGGRFRYDRVLHHWVDAVDDFGDRSKDPAPQLATVYRWREAYQADFAARMDWCVKKFEEANHPPVVKVVAGQTVRGGDRVLLDASGSSDPDGQELEFQWWVYKEAGTFDGKVEIEAPSSAKATMNAPAVSELATIHVVVSVKDKGKPALTRYGRVVLSVAP